MFRLHCAGIIRPNLKPVKERCTRLCEPTVRGLFMLQAVPCGRTNGEREREQLIAVVVVLVVVVILIVMR